ncbi:MAG: allophanate hydrolase subunit 1 [Proteobacteria bacterium]|nr:allophanate hydrolase subunit 1 [Pseudomonadota bacterium]
MEQAGQAPPRILRMGLSGILVQFSDRLDGPANRRSLDFGARLAAALPEGVEEVAPSLGGVYLRLDPLRADHGAIEARLRGLVDGEASDAVASARRWTIPAVFGGTSGPDLDAVAAAVDLGAKEALADLVTQSLRVMAIGFAPGLPYMGILPERWDIPRKAGLTPKVPQGGIVVAVRQAIIFPTDTPTGWWHVGQTGFRGFRPGAAEPFLLRPGDEVRLRPVGQEELRALNARDPEGGGALVEAVLA